MAPLAIPVGEQLALPTPVVHKFTKPKVSNYTNKLQVGLERTNPKTIDHFLISLTFKKFTLFF